MFKKAFLIFICLVLVLQTLPASAAAIASKVVYDEFADVSVTIGSSFFKVFALKKIFMVAPYSAGAVTYVQADSILPWLGYKLNYDVKKKVLTVTSAAQNIIIKADNTVYSVNGKSLKFSKAPKITMGKLMVPLEELFRSLGYTVKSDRLAKTVSITRFKSFDFGSFAFYDKPMDLQNFYRLDGKGLYKEEYKDLLINQLYSYKGIILGYVYDRVKRVNRLVKYENGKFADLKANFDMVSTYEFGDNRVFYGYDNTDKKYKLYRFNGTGLILVADDCYSSIQINFNNSIILNKYDSSRNYSIVRVDQNWNISVLDTGKTMTEYFISDSWLYIKATPQEGTGIYFLVFNGTSIIKVTIASDGLSSTVKDIDFNAIRICNGKIYAILPVESHINTYSKVVSGKLFQLEESKAIMLPFDQYDSNLTLIESFNGKLYLSGSHKVGTSKLYTTFEYTPGGSYTVINDPKLNNRNLMFGKSLVAYGTMFLSGKLLGQTGNSSEDVLYAFRNGVWNYTMDIVEIESVIQTPRGLYLNVKDYDRAVSKTNRDSVLFIDNSLSISNAAIDFNITNQSVVGNSLVFAGANKITKRSEVNRHDISYDELIPGFSAAYWEFINNQVFTGGKQDNISSLYKITDTTVAELKDNFEAKNVLATKNPGFYLIYGIERDKTSIYNDSCVLYLYDMQKAVFSLVTAGVDIKQIIMYK